MSDIESTAWSETAASNNSATPNGWPEGQAPSSVNDCSREMMRALKTDWNRSHATISSTGSANAYILTYTTAPASYINGQRFAFKASFANTGSATANVNGLGAKTIQKNGAAGLANLASGDIQSGQHVHLEYDSGGDVLVCISDLPTSATFTGGALTSALNEAQGANIASGSTTDIGAATGNSVTVTGVTTISNFGTVQAGTRRIVTFSGVLTLTYNATSMILPTSANITTAAGDVGTFISLGSGNWKCASWQPASGMALAGSVSGIAVKTSDYPIVTADSGSILIANKATAIAFTMPSGSSLGAGARIRFRSIGAGALTIGRTGSDVFASGSSVALTSLVFQQGDAGELVSDGASPATFYWSGARHYDSGQQTITFGGSVSLTHNLGIPPNFSHMILHCTSTDASYSAGDEVQFTMTGDSAVASEGITLLLSSTNAIIYYATNGVQVVTKGGGAVTTITAAKWTVIVRAYVMN